ncbi:MAG TPA: PilZ domain-containing protein [Polyangia bacterium]|jgi:uncharacterized protein (TIGR02266 family)
MSSGAVDPHPPQLLAQDPDSTQPRASRRGRSAAEIPVDLHGAAGPFPGITRNISREGAFIATHQPLPPGTRFLLFLVFPGDRKPLAVRAEVRWARAASGSSDERPAGMGVSFVDPPLGVTLSITDLIESTGSNPRT